MKFYKCAFVTMGFLVLLFLAGCGDPGNEETRSNETNRPQQERTSPSGSSGVQSKSDTLPLLPIMINLEQNMNAIQSGMWREDYDRIEQAAEGIGNHAKIPKSEIKTIRSILGKKEFKKFVADDKTVHRKSLELAGAARKENFKKVTDLYVDLYRGCVSCHLNHRETIRRSPQWK
ncbi:MAG: hypothetical protein ABEK50_13510 [bacterium]